eukprot:5894874-Prorocentrum_lima.AAC.1
MGFWCVGSTNSQFQALSVGSLGDNTIQGALMSDPGASHFLMPMTSLPKTATGTSLSVVRLAVGDAQAVYCNDE